MRVLGGTVSIMIGMFLLWLAYDMWNIASIYGKVFLWVWVIGASLLGGLLFYIAWILMTENDDAD